MFHSLEITSPDLYALFNILFNIYLLMEILTVNNLISFFAWEHLKKTIPMMVKYYVIQV